jgi:hypothetical protein
LFLLVLLTGGLATLTVSACGSDAVAVAACVPEDVNPSLFCNVTYCSDDAVVNDSCTDFYDACATSGVGLEDCVGGALASCQVEEPAPDPTLFCNETYCSAEPVRNQECRQFFAACLIENPSTHAEECAAGALAVCRDGPDLFCNEEVCSINPVKQQECRVGFAACLSAGGVTEYDECVVAQLIFCKTP